MSNACQSVNGYRYMIEEFIVYMPHIHYTESCTLHAKLSSIREGHRLMDYLLVNLQCDNAQCGTKMEKYPKVSHTCVLYANLKLMRN